MVLRTDRIGGNGAEEPKPSGTAIKTLGEIGEEETLLMLRRSAESGDIARFGKQAAARAVSRLETRIGAAPAVGEFANGQERPVWNPAHTIPAKEFDFPDTEVARIKAAIETWDQYNAAIDR